jgi:hypothetical protein
MWLWRGCHRFLRGRLGEGDCVVSEMSRVKACWRTDRSDEISSEIENEITKIDIV